MNRRDLFRKITIKQAVCTVLLLLETAAAAQTGYLVHTLGVRGMETGAVISSTVSLLCLILGVFLFAGAAAMKGKNGCFLAMAFLLHMLMAYDCAGWYLGGRPGYAAVFRRIMNLLFVLDIFFTPVSLLLIRQLTGMGVTVRELLTNRDGFDRLEMSACIFGMLLLLIFWISNFFTGVLFSVTPEGIFVYGSGYTVYFAIVFAGEAFGLVRLIRARRSLRQLLLFFMIFSLAAAGCILDGFGVSVDISYALAFLILFRIFSEFFTVLRFANYRYSDVLETYVSWKPAEDGEEEETGAGREYRGTVLLSDLRGFTAQSGNLTTGDTVEVLNRYMSSMMSVVRENGGNVTEFLGDGLLCVFGAPEPQEDHADRALAAAVRMQQAMTEVNVWNEEHGYPVLRMGIGISTGKFTFGNIGTMQVARPMAVGSPVNEVFRAETYALGGQIVLTGEAVKALKREPLIRQEIRHESEEGREILLYQTAGFKEDPAAVLSEKEESMYEPEMPLHIAVRRVDGKHIDDKPAEGLLYAISPRKAAVRLPWKPEPLEYVCFTLKEPPEGVYYARIPMNAAGNTVTADLTGLPEGMEKKYRELMER